jgi:hypothetical protein
MTRVFLVLVLLGLASSAPAQDAAAPARDTIELSFTRGSGRAGEDVELPVTLKSETVVAAPFEMVVKFPAGALTYAGFKTAYLAQYAGWTMNATLQRPEKDGDPASLRIEVDPGSKDFFPSGVVGYVQFRINEGVPDGDIPIDAELKLAAAARLTPAVVAGKVTVYTNLMMSCFLYMH